MKFRVVAGKIMADELGTQKNPWAQFRDYVATVRVEMKRVSWPSKQEVYGTTVMVILTTFLFAGYFAICDVIFRHGIDELLKLMLRRR